MADFENNKTLPSSEPNESEFVSKRTERLREIARSIGEYNHEDEWLL